MISDVREIQRGQLFPALARAQTEAWARADPGTCDPARPVGGKERKGRSVCWGTSPPWALDPGEVSLRVAGWGTPLCFEKHLPTPRGWA